MSEINSLRPGVRLLTVPPRKDQLDLGGSSEQRSSGTCLSGMKSSAVPGMPFSTAFQFVGAPGDLPWLTVGLEPPRPIKRASLEETHRATPIDHSVDVLRPASVFASRRPRLLSGIREASESRAEPDHAPPSQEISIETHSVAGSNSANVHHEQDGPAPVFLTHPHRGSSSVSLPLTSLPERLSSRPIQRRRSDAFVRSDHFSNFPSLDPPPPRGSGSTIPSRGQPTSPVRSAIQRNAVSSDAMRRMPSRTFVRSVKPTDILDLPTATHPRVEMDLRVAAPLFVGGGTVEGEVHLKVDSSSSSMLRKPFRIMVARISVDIVGVEEMSDGRQWIFTSLATELIDEHHPPPLSLITSPSIASKAEPFWVMKSASANIPFRLNLPLNMGPPPYKSKSARIRYILCSTTLIKVNGRQHIIRQSSDIAVLTVFDPEKALSSLPSPLIASDEVQLPGVIQTNSVKLTAGLHRQTWVDGANIFVDVHVLNNSSKVIRRLEVQIEKTTLFYSHAAAGTVEKSVQHLRLPARSETELIARLVVRKDKLWKGVPPRSNEIRTCEIEVPKGHVTISTGRYFEVRYFLNIQVGISMFKVIQVQLPISLIHMNSLDIVPNSLAQVAAAIDDKRCRSATGRSSLDPAINFSQGQAFTAPRRLSVGHDHGILEPDQILDLRQELDDSPRKFKGTNAAGHPVSHGRSSQGLLSRERSQPHDVSRCHRRHASSISSIPRLPRIQISTSGLGFSDTDFDVSPVRPGPRVYNYEEIRDNWTKARNRNPLSERERRDLRVQQELIRARKRGRERKILWGWRNVAVERAFDDGAVPILNGRKKAVWVDQ